MCKYLSITETKNYKYYLHEDGTTHALDLSTGEVITDAARVAELFGNLAAAFGVKIEKPKPPKSKTDKQKEPKHKYGVYGWVELTEQELQKLYDDLGEERANQCINFVDERAEITHNRNKWKNFNLVVRNCHREQWPESKQRQQPQAKPETSYDINLFKERAEKLPVYKGRGGS